MINNLIIGAGPVGLFTALLLKKNNNNNKITILESRHSFTREQVLLINEQNFNKLVDLGISKDIFAKIERPRKSINGRLCKTHDKTCVDQPNMYSVQINILQDTMFKKIKDEYTDINTKTYIPLNNSYSILTTKYNNSNKKLLLSKKEGRTITIFKDIDLKKFDNIFLCTGEKDQLSIYFTRTYKSNEKNDINNPEGCIVFIKPKNNNIKNKLMLNKISQPSELLQTLEFEDRYRLFFSPTILNNNQTKARNNINIYMGIQISYNELETIKNIIGPSNNRTKFKEYIKKCVEIALKNYYKDFDYSEDKYEINITNHFPIILKFNEQNVMTLKDTNTKLFLMGDGKFGVNFFSGTGVNYGLTHASIVVDVINNNPSNNVNIIEQNIRNKLVVAKITKDDLFTSSIDVSLFDTGKDIEYINKIILPDLQSKSEKNSYNLINELVNLYNASNDSTMKLALKSFILSFTYIKNYSITFKLDGTLNNYNNKIINNIFKNCKTDIRLIKKDEMTNFKKSNTIPSNIPKDTFELLSKFIDLLNILNDYDITKKNIIHKIITNVLNKYNISDFELQIILSIVEKLKEIYKSTKNIIYINTLVFIIDKIILLQRRNSININKKIILDMTKSINLELKNYAESI